MPSLDLLLLPLLGGFLFVSQWYPTKYSALRSAGYKLLFMAAIAGVVFLFIATLLITSVYNSSYGEWAAIQWHKFVPFTHSGKAALSFLTAAFLWWPLNLLGEALSRLWEALSQPGWLRWLRWLSDDAAVDRAIDRKRDPLELLLRESLGSWRTIAVTLKTGKVYIGNLTTNLNPAFAVESIHLLLRRSGHRDPDTQVLTIDVDYDKTLGTSRNAVIEEFRRRLIEVASEYPDISDVDLARLARARITTVSDIQNFEIVILISEVVSVNYFELQLYDEQFKMDKNEASVTWSVKE